MNSGIHILHPDKASFSQTLRDAETGSQDFIITITGALGVGAEALKAHLDECIRALKSGGLLFIQGLPEYLPELGVYLDQRLKFKYWIAVESAPRRKHSPLPSVHAGILLFTKGDAFRVTRTRIPHGYCSACGRSLRDWGGKSHLMHPDGSVISDVWTDLPPADNYGQVSDPALQTILRMMDLPPDASGIIGPQEGTVSSEVDALSGSEAPRMRERTVNEPADELVNVVHQGDAVETLRRYPNACIDLAFADPPYNLKKEYGVYDDRRERERYIAWCNEWLAEYVRVLKPTGSLYLLNLPRWTMYHADFLNRHLHFQNWIVWDALSEPRGKLMPAHYGLLFYTKHPSDFTFNYADVGPVDSRCYCLRASCIHKRKSIGRDDKEAVTDIWWDIHRIRHRRDRDHHPCQLPDALLERIIRLSTDEGDIVLDALCGAGTALVAAARLDRRYVGIDLDESYVAITKEKLAQVEKSGRVERVSIRKVQREHTKKELHLELRDLAARLGRLPTPEDVVRMSRYELHAFLEAFSTWGKALKAAKLEALD